MIQVAVRDEHEVDRLLVIGVGRRRGAADEGHAVGEDRVGEDAAPGQLDEHGGMAEVAQGCGRVRGEGLSRWVIIATGRPAVRRLQAGRAIVRSMSTPVELLVPEPDRGSGARRASRPARDPGCPPGRGRQPWWHSTRRRGIRGAAHRPRPGDPHGLRRGDVDGQAQGLAVAPPIGSGSTSPAPTGSATIRIGSCRPSASLTHSSAGTHERLWEVLGAHPREHQGVAGVAFAVWAPNARSVRVVGDFDRWDGRSADALARCIGRRESFVPGIGPGELYKYEVLGADGKLRVKADPLSFSQQVRRRPHRACGTSASTKAGPMTPGWPTAPAATRIGQCRSTRSIRPWRRNDGRLGYAGRRAAGGALPSVRLHPRRCCRWPSIRSTARGATRSPATTRPRPASAPG